MATITEYRGGLVMTTGANIRPRDPAEDKYHLAATTPPRGAAWDGVTPILPFCQPGGPDDRYPYDDGQGQLGACVAFTIREAVWSMARTAARKAGNDLRLDAVRPIHPGIVYEDGRKLRGWFPNDTGMYDADAADLVMAGTPDGTAGLYYADRTYQYPRSLWNGREGRDYEASHRPFFPTDADVWTEIATALLSEFGVMCGSYWPNGWFQPMQGVVSATAAWSPNDSGHEYSVWGLTKSHLLCGNHWTKQWTPDAMASGLPMMRPGDFAIPREVVERPGSPIFGFRAIAFEPVPAPTPPDPDPDPQPEPEPTPPAPDGWQAAIAAGTAEAASMHDYASLAPHSISRKWWALGGDWMLSKIASAQPGAAVGGKMQRP